MTNTLWTPSMSQYYKLLNQISHVYGISEFHCNNSNLLICVKPSSKQEGLDDVVLRDHEENSSLSSESSTVTKRLKFTPKTDAERQAIAFRKEMGTPNVDMAYNVTTKDVDLGNVILQLSQFFKRPTVKKPCFIYYHGGDFVGNGPAVSRNFCRKLAELIGGTVINVDYRLAPEVNADDLLADCWQGLKFAHDNAKKLGIDLNHLYVAGDSAGGNIAIEMAYLDLQKDTHLVKGIVPIYPMVQNDLAPSYQNLSDLPKSQQKLINDMDSGNIQALGYLGGVYSEPHSMSETLISPINMATSELKQMPRTLIVTAEYDCLKSQDDEFANKLAVFHNDVQLIRYEGMMHGFLDKFGIVPQSEDVCRQMSAWTFENE